MAEEDNSTHIPGERAETSTARGHENNPAVRRGVVALAIVAFVGFALWSMRGQEKPADGVQPERVVIRQTSDFELSQGAGPTGRRAVGKPPANPRHATADGRGREAPRRRPPCARHRLWWREITARPIVRTKMRALMPPRTTCRWETTRAISLPRRKARTSASIGC